MEKHLRRALRVAAFGAVFGAGYLVATVTQPVAQAQMGDLGKKAMDAAGSQGGALGSVTEMGQSLMEMRENVNALSANLDKLEKIKAALGGG